jgi:hypothetical protein
MRCPKCSAGSKVVSTEKGHAPEGRFLPKEDVKSLIEEWGENSCFRKRVCSSGHSFVTVEFCRDD